MVEVTDLNVSPEGGTMVAPDQLESLSVELGSTSSSDLRVRGFLPRLLKCSFLTAAALSFLESRFSDCDEEPNSGCVRGGARAMPVEASMSTDCIKLENFIDEKA
jgi:hypothetical protein